MKQPPPKKKTPLILKDLKAQEGLGRFMIWEEEGIEDLCFKSRKWGPYSQGKVDRTLWDSDGRLRLLRVSRQRPRSLSAVPLR